MLFDVTFGYCAEQAEAIDEDTIATKHRRTTSSTTAEVYTNWKRSLRRCARPRLVNTAILPGFVFQCPGQVEFLAGASVPL